MAQLVMVLIMTMTPVHLRHGGQGLDWVGVVFASHTFGMFAFSPVAGHLSDRLGRIPMIALASGVLAVSGVLASLSSVDSPWLGVALFLLGLGWCLSFVAASALLTESLDPARRLRLQGVVDSFVWGGAALAGLSSGVLLSAVGYERLGQIGAALAFVPLAFLRPGRARRDPARDRSGSRVPVRPLD
jgi:MFS family permease